MRNLSPSSHEYKIYAYNFPDNITRESPWRLVSSLNDYRAAALHAKQLHDSKKFHKIEIRRNAIDPKSNRAVDVSVQIYENNQNGLSAHAVAIIGASALAVVTFACALFLAGGITLP